MKKGFLLLCAIACLLWSSCNNEDPEPPDQPYYTDLQVVTGLDFFDDNGSAIGRWKTPNHKPGEIATFPNPNIGTVYVFSLEEITHIWLLPADCLTDSVTIDIPALSKNLTYEISELEDAQIRDIPVSNFNAYLALDLSDVSKGFYRIFYQLESGELFWQNLYIDPTVNNIPTFDFLGNICD